MQRGIPHTLRCPLARRNHSRSTRRHRRRRLSRQNEQLPSPDLDLLGFHDHSVRPVDTATSQYVDQFCGGVRSDHRCGHRRAQYHHLFPGTGPTPAQCQRPSTSFLHIPSHLWTGEQNLSILGVIIAHATKKKKKDLGRHHRRCHPPKRTLPPPPRPIPSTLPTRRRNRLRRHPTHRRPPRTSPIRRTHRLRRRTAHNVVCSHWDFGVGVGV